MGRDTVLGVAAGCRALPGTAALLRERLPMLEQGQPVPPSAEELADERAAFEDEHQAALEERRSRAQ